MIKGAKKLSKQLDKVSNIDLDKALLQACLIVERAAKEIVPVDTGHLRRSITSVVDEGRGVIGTSVEYAPNVELGIGQRPQPFLTPAFLNNLDDIKEIIRKETQQEIKEVVK